MSGKYQAYPECKDSGVEWLANLPSHWGVKRLGQYLFERRDKVSDKDYSALSVTKNGIVPQLETAAKTDAGDNRKLVLAGDFVINSRSDRKGSSGLSDLDGSVSLISIVLQPKNIEPGFVHHLLRSYPFQEEFYRYGKGIVADLWSTNYSEMKNISLPIPDRSEQRTIAAFLDHEIARIDRLIEKQQRLIELLKEKRQAVISHVVTKGLDPNVPMKDSGVEWLGQVPEHWGLPKLIHVTTRIGDGLHSTPVYEDGTGYYFVNGNNFSAGIIKLGPSSKEVPDSEYLKHHTPLDHSTVLMSINGTIGNLALYRSEPVILGKSACYINCGHELDRRFLLGFLRSNEIDHYFDTEVTGTTIYNLSLNSVRQMRVCLPPRTEQDEIVRYCEQKDQKFERLIGHAAKAVELLQERRTALISAAVTGKIDVRNWQPNISTQTTEPDLPLAAEQAGRYHV